LSASAASNVTRRYHIPAEQIRIAQIDGQPSGKNDQLAFDQACGRCDEPLIEETAADVKRTTRTQNDQREHSKESYRAARILAGRTNADATGRQRDARSRSTPLRAILPFNASDDRGTDKSTINKGERRHV